MKLKKFKSTKIPAKKVEKKRTTQLYSLLNIRVEKEKLVYTEEDLRLGVVPEKLDTPRGPITYAFIFCKKEDKLAAKSKLVEYLRGSMTREVELVNKLCKQLGRI